MEKNYEFEKVRFVQAFNAEEERITRLKEKFPDNRNYQDSYRNLSEMKDSFRYIAQYIQALETRISLLQTENHLLAQDYMKGLANELDTIVTLTKKA